MLVKIQENEDELSVIVTATATPSLRDIQESLEQIRQLRPKSSVDLYFKKLHLMTEDAAQKLGEDLANLIIEKKIYIESLHINVRDTFDYQLGNEQVQFFYSKNSLIIAERLLAILDQTPEIDFDSGSCTRINFSDVEILSPHAKKITHISVNNANSPEDTSYFQNIDCLAKLLSACTNLEEFTISGRLCDQQNINSATVDSNGNYKESLESQIPKSLLLALTSRQPHYVQLPSASSLVVTSLLKCPNILFLKSGNRNFHLEQGLPDSEINELYSAIQNATQLKKCCKFEISEKYPSHFRELVTGINERLSTRVSKNLAAAELIYPAVYKNDLAVLQCISTAAFFRLFTAHYSLVTFYIEDKFCISKKDAISVMKSFQENNLDPYSLFLYITGVAPSAQAQLLPEMLRDSEQPLSLLNLPEKILNKIMNFLTPLDINSLIR